ncbi:SDR family oxidoreductase [Ruixingdingia sedimenti]|uniref:SDR family NAD(P)-dependent oxidoreductase n=1 Tax=Ruixingdingia sedimenti TaxID=3073604 RepID=A0ABU1F6U9_9RHOB|nr:SDR family NAD(P)-dependent oxidoreductase [Xinfangfangia sp. LG-4]MDR5652164.1 SDR family NAD(P)-dependent oxidoreductase [Xinfangfangia sp. LG-4]
MRLDGRHVIITGASRGIGAAAAAAFAAAGARVSLLARDGAAAGRVADAIGPAARAAAADVADAASLAAAIAAAEAALGPVDVLVNNAGVIDPIGPLAGADPAAWGRAIDVNLKGVMHGMRAVLPGMIARRRGTVITVGSGAAHNPQEGWSAYCAAKAGAFMLTRAAHLEAGPHGVRVLSLSPGTVATDMQRTIRDSGINPVSRLDWSAHVPPGWPARALVWMCSPDADDLLGGEVGLRDETIRRRIGLAP